MLRTAFQQYHGHEVDAQRDAFGVFFVNLAPISDTELMVPTIAQTLGVKESPTRSIVKQLHTFLQEKLLLLVLDNFEQVVSAACIVRPEHVVEMFRLLGGGVIGDLVGLPRSQLAVLPGTTHVTLADRVEWLTPMITEFLDAPMPEAR